MDHRELCNIYLECSECGRRLDVTGKREDALEVFPCKRCIEDAKSAAYEDGYSSAKED